MTQQDPNYDDDIQTDCYDYMTNRIQQVIYGAGRKGMPIPDLDDDWQPDPRPQGPTGIMPDYQPYRNYYPKG
jgi:hypothetical protein